MNIEILKNMSVESLIYTTTFVVSIFVAIAAVIRGMFDKSLIGRTLSGLIWAVILGLAFGAIGKPIAYLVSRLNLDFLLLDLFQIGNFRVLCGFIIGFILGATSYIYTIIKFVWEAFGKITLWPIKLMLGGAGIAVVVYVILNYINF